MTREEAIAYGNRVIDLGLNDETQLFCEVAVRALKELQFYKDCLAKEEKRVEGCTCSKYKGSDYDYHISTHYAE